MAEGTIKNVGDILKNVRENFENYGANFSFVGVFSGDCGRKCTKPSDEFGNFFKFRWEIAFFGLRVKYAPGKGFNQLNFIPL